MTTPIDAELLRKVPLSEIQRVTFYKRNEITTDLICCDIEMAGNTWTFHEELYGWQMLVRYLESLPGFQKDWFARVSQPPFSASQTVAFSRA